ncbi:MAG: YggT family protein [Paenibacillaceae bacterium]|uniref:YggT family protein n=1 Tax=Paenibacillus cymbidii TaxID=1639034 RepID=UPI001080C5D2|nr:YggT family protein [Paenibacillus cymbidii]MBO9604982.1 YggT family protein [Paenibacillaceae bacterium]
MDAVFALIDTLQYIYYLLIIAYVLLSWLPNVRESFIGELLGKVVEPYLTPFRKIIPPIGGMLDISPIIALFALRFVVLGIKEVIAYVAGWF